MGKKKRFGNPMKEKAYRESLKNEKTKKRISFMGFNKNLTTACNQLLNKYPYVLCCSMGEIVHTHACFEHELQDEYHWVVEQVYSKNWGRPVSLINSTHPSNKVCPQEEIMKHVRLAKQKNENLAEFKGGSYDFMVVVFEPFDNAVIAQSKEGTSHNSGGRGKDVSERMDWHSRRENEIWWYSSQKSWYGKVDGKIKRLGNNHDYALEKVA